MPIPTIAPYPMPAAQELPPNKASWQPDPARVLLLIHDMQRYFLDFFTPGRPPVTDLLDNVSALRSGAAAAGVPVAYTAQRAGMTRSQRGLLHDFWGPGMKADPRRQKIADELAPAPGDIVLTKWRYSSFHRTDLEQVLARHGRDQLVICGIYAHIGCLVTAVDAFMLDVQPFLVADAVADFSAEEHRMALRFAAERCAVTLPTHAIVDLLAGSMSKSA